MTMFGLLSGALIRDVRAIPSVAGAACFTLVLTFVTASSAMDHNLQQDSHESDDADDIQIWTDGRGSIVRVNCWGGEKEFTIVLQLRALRELRLSNPEMGDTVLERLARSPCAATLLTLDIAQTSITADGYKHLESFRSLKELTCNSPCDGALALHHISNLGGLRSLTLHSVRPPAETWECLGELHDLEELVSFNTPFGDAGLAILAGLPKLRRMELDENGIADAGLKHLRRASCLEHICACDDGITDDGLRELSGVASLREVLIRSRSIKGPGVRFLRRLPQLAFLDLRDTDVDDSVVEDLINFPALKRIALDCTRVSRAGALRLQAALPHCDISWRSAKDVQHPPKVLARSNLKNHSAGDFATA